MKTTFFKIGTAITAATLYATTALAGDLVINFDDPNPKPKLGIEAAVEAFKAANPDINVTLNITDREAHKTAIRNFLSAEAPDVTAWYPGNRMAPFVNAGQFEDISDLWASDPNLSTSFEAIKPTMSMNGKQYGVPYSYYQWGIYYRKDIFDKAGITEEPKTWDELMAACGKLKAAGVTPFTIGTKFLWTAAGVFDYINLRTNGYEFHNDLTAGKVKYTDPKVRQVFTNWKQMLDECSFVDNHATMSWQDALAPFAKGEAAMYVMGNFAVAAMKDAGLTDDQIDYMRFPEITPGLPRAEEAPADALFIPTNAKNKEDARKFLAFVARPEIQSEWNKTIGQLPPNSKAAVSDDKFIQEGFETVSTASGLAQFFDRDAPAEMAKAGMEGFQEFMLKPDRLDKILERLDKVQARVYK
ncbi:ABC transporter substrate-binding protein [Ahrensia sp. R2A130]|uniref:ABC transporter substrate-binding protein n=1 Tax=Ahrensia sp. R2A130 TaxID=744979 RepID=UPI0001E083E8|nr:ABC transporter substrate-binding protein [Ahrensia sp. R2A130]EFL89231.1 putative ABC transporter, periplasmic solute-binding protein [Ahrensia sp. R2A130]